MNTSKIVHVIGALVAGGAEKFVVDLLVEMKKKGYDVSLLVLSSRTDKAGELFTSKLKDADVACYIGTTNKVGFKSLLWFAKVLPLIKPDYIHLHTPNTELAYYLAGRFYKHSHKLFRTIHNTSIKYGAITKRAFNKNNVIKTIACGNSTFEAYKDSITDDFEIIQNGVAFDWPAKSIEISHKAREALNLSDDVKHYLCVGSMSADSMSDSQKAQDILIQSWIDSKMGDSGAVLHLLGTGNLIEDFMNLAKGNESIIFHGVSKDVKTWLLACDYFIMPSRYEGLPIAAIEAIATGIFCIFSDIKPLHELKPPYVYWVDKESNMSLSKALNLSLNTENNIDIKKIEEFRNVFSITHTAQSYLNLYN